MSYILLVYLPSIRRNNLHIVDKYILLGDVNDCSVSPVISLFIITGKWSLVLDTVKCSLVSSL
ncbi:unnamed protein product [Schistosoma margrebowiei]|uniref:Uncharacterized protein n=1 Tax=Schistosoma margrebowiei TaxID=48269 RepID=A0A183LV99_9TREM|nr:unnamed protein product [Schistosoma margrebowiei]